MNRTCTSLSERMVLGLGLGFKRVSQVSTFASRSKPKLDSDASTEELQLKECTVGKVVLEGAATPGATYVLDS